MRDGRDNFAFVKRQCMHCLDPACVTGCPFGALKKNTWGAVTWNSSLCIGCRYCEVGCPLDVPKFQWDKWNPKVVRCELCFDQRLQQNQELVCTAVCPTHAVIFGKRNYLLAEAKQCISDAPEKYFENRVYGEHEAGGTQVLYLSGVAFDKIGLPKLGGSALRRSADPIVFRLTHSGSDGSPHIFRDRWVQWDGASLYLNRTDGRQAEREGPPQWFLGRWQRFLQVVSFPCLLTVLQRLILVPSGNIKAR